MERKPLRKACAKGWALYCLTRTETLLGDEFYEAELNSVEPLGFDNTLTRVMGNGFRGQPAALPMGSALSCLPCPPFLSPYWLQVWSLQPWPFWSGPWAGRVQEACAAKILMEAGGNHQWAAGACSSIFVGLLGALGLRAEGFQMVSLLRRSRNQELEPRCICPLTEKLWAQLLGSQFASVAFSGSLSFLPSLPPFLYIQVFK